MDRIKLTLKHPSLELDFQRNVYRPRTLDSEVDHRPNITDKHSRNFFSINQVSRGMTVDGQNLVSSLEAALLLCSATRQDFVHRKLPQTAVAETKS